MTNFRYHLMLGMEIMECSLLEKLHKNYYGDNNPDYNTWTVFGVLKWCVQISQGLQYLTETEKIVHRDIAPRNILVDAKEQPQTRIEY